MELPPGIMLWIFWCIFSGKLIGILQKLYYQIRRRICYIQECPVNSVDFSRDRRKISLFLIIVYLLFIMCEFYVKSSQNFYEILKISPYSLSKGKLKTHFHKIALKIHPDKIKNGDATEFIRLRLAYNVLSNEKQRFAYERLGPSMIEWSKTVSLYEILFESIKPTFQFYGGIIFVSLVFNFLGIKPLKTFWYFYIIGLWFTLEVLSIIRSYPIFPFNFIFLRKLPFEFLTTIHTFLRIFLLAWSDIEFILFSEKNVIDISENSKKIFSLSSILLDESNHLLEMEYSCYGDKSVAKDRIKKRIKEVVLENQVNFELNRLKKLD
ncbi:hypothetical protein PNEG_01677 [Pneumocystis murina B123]|uniref:J domain-containing protein n=1 Tax=Pneumocystis murina (strain B123) TaxID=1069680 RepID=M7NRL8_PNEMU|nr:hypothetical protein PNEG_01677 [Pneumocystis murina B123]EMR09917.1 hypothetical protein PNEG_01677 [Pneumocystis murina B123]